LKVLINGAEGQLAKALKRTLKPKSEHSVAFLSRKDWDIGDEQSTWAIVKEYQPDVLINTAAYTKVDLAEKEFSQAAMINHRALNSISSASNQFGVRLIHVSTDYVFDGLKGKPFMEDDPCFPLNNYGLTKRLGELAITRSAIDYAILRTSWLYTSTGNNFFNTILRLAKEKAEISIVSDQVSAPTYAEDLADTIWRIIEPCQKKIKGIYHYSNSGQASWFQFASAIVKHAGIDCVVRPIPSADYPQAAKRPGYSKLNTDKISNQLNIDIPSWQDGLQRCWEDFKNL